MEQANNPHYLKTYNDHKTNNRFSSTVIDDFAEVPIAEIDLPVPLKIPGGSRTFTTNNSHIIVSFLCDNRFMVDALHNFSYLMLNFYLIYIVQANYNFKSLLCDLLKP
jgi:hypothetical protein